jgi:hypothetical protein
MDIRDNSLELRHISIEFKIDRILDYLIPDKSQNNGESQKRDTPGQIRTSVVGSKDAASASRLSIWDNYVPRLPMTDHHTIQPKITQKSFNITVIFVEDDLLDFIKIRCRGLSASSQQDIKKAALILWESTEGQIIKRNLIYSQRQF